MCCNFAVSLTVTDGTQTNDSSGEKEADESGSDNTTSVEEKSGEFLTVAGNEPPASSPSAYSQSPTLRALQQMESGDSNQSATCRPVKDGEEMRYHGYTNPHKQSRSFQMLEQGLRMAESGQGVFVCIGEVCPLQNPVSSWSFQTPVVRSRSQITKLL